jgi:hypothetical protein
MKSQISSTSVHLNIEDDKKSVFQLIKMQKMKTSKHIGNKKNY